MEEKLEYLIVTTGRESIDFVENMNIKAPTIITNQANLYSVELKGKDFMLTTATRGVGVNRNLGMNLSNAEFSLLVDDDMIFYDNADATIIAALEQNEDADVIIFNFDYVKNGKFVRTRMKKSERIGKLNCLNYGICCALVRNSKIKQKNIAFSTLFGGGCKYSCGEDSLFFLDCIRKGLKIYSYAVSIGKNEYRESTWFKGFDEKFFFDKGAWIACAFPKLKHFIKWYFAIRFGKMTEIPFNKRLALINKGIKGFYSQYCYENPWD